tara:strand:- start:11710 stop:12054 length:345 start_codon:yes stop_codon:yes gene_type:complete
MDSDLKLIDDFRKKSKQIRNKELRQNLLQADRALRFAEGNSSKRIQPSKPSFKTMGRQLVKGFVQGSKAISPLPQIAIFADMMNAKPAGAGSDKPTKQDLAKQKKYLQSLKKSK